MKIKIVVIGNTKEKIYQSKIKEYLKWISKDIPIEIINLKKANKRKLNDKLKKYFGPNYFTICLSENGIQQNSKAFSSLIFKQNKQIIFFIGEHDGHSKIVQKSANQFLSFSKMTMPHEMSLLFLCEQIFRAISIKKGSKYHR